MQAASRAGRWRPAGGYVPVFWKHGYADTSVQELERATGVTVNQAGDADSSRLAFHSL
jgi:hypothetical protein